MTIRRKKGEELKVAGAKLALKIIEQPTQAWIDSRSPISIFTIGELKGTLGKLFPIDPKDNQFRDYGKNLLELMEKLTLHSNGWTTQATINVIWGCRPSIISRDLMPVLGLMLVKTPAE